METTQSVASAMTAVVGLWGTRPDLQDVKGRNRNDVEAIELLYPTVEQKLRDTRYYILENWLYLTKNSAIQSEVADYLDALKEFFGKLRWFENEFCRSGDTALMTFDDMWIARRYFVMMLDQTREYDRLFKQFEGFGHEKPSYARPFKGSAKAFAKYVGHCTDTEFESFVREGKPFSELHEWGGSRQEAVLFAEYFGLKAKHMNHCFVFKSSNGMHRDLNLEHDRPKAKDGKYPIQSVLDQFAHCRAM